MTLSPPSVVRGTLTVEPYQLSQSDSILTSHKDGSIRIWDYHRGIQIYGFETGKTSAYYFPAIPLNIHEYVGEVVHRIASGHKEGVVRLWRIPAPDLGADASRQEEDEMLPCPRSATRSKKTRSNGFRKRIRQVYLMLFLDMVRSSVVLAWLSVFPERKRSFL